MSKNLFFVDDSGSRTWETPYTKDFIVAPPDRTEYIEYWRRNYFVLAGIYVSSEKINDMVVAIENEKQRYFKTKDVEIKSHWLRTPEKRKIHYLEKYSISYAELRDFVENFWYGLFRPENFTVQAFVLDKRLFEKRDSSVIEVVAKPMFSHLSAGSRPISEIIFDQMENKIRTDRGAHGIIQNEARSQPFSVSHGDTSIRFESSAQSNFIQLADMVAYNVYRHFVDTGTSLDGGEESVVYKYLEKIIPLFESQNGKINNHGIIQIPTIE